MKEARFRTGMSRDLVKVRTMQGGGTQLTLYNSDSDDDDYKLSVELSTADVVRLIWLLVRATDLA